MVRTCTVSLLVLSVVLSGCGTQFEDGKGAMGDRCIDNSGCESNLCVAAPGQTAEEWYCSRFCAGGETCPEGMVCTVLGSGANVCLNRCTASFIRYNEVPTLPFDYACIDGVPTFCTSELSASGYCMECGCANESEYCDEWAEPDTCVAMSEVGGPCKIHEHCLSGNCSINSHVSDVEPGECYVPLGSACTDENCGYCWASGQFCSRLCGDCPEGFTCVGDADIDRYWCHTDCALGQCCYGIGFDDCGHCSPDESACPAGFSCHRVVGGPWEVTVGYACGPEI